MMAAVAPPIEPNIPRVLFVDDEATYLASVEAAASGLGVHIATAESSEEGLSMVQRGNLTAVVCDWKMPGADGISLLEHVHKYDPNLPLALQTGYALSSYEQMRLEKIRARYYSKGTRVEEIIRTLLDQAGVP